MIATMTKEDIGYILSGGKFKKFKCSRGVQLHFCELRVWGLGGEQCKTKCSRGVIVMGLGFRGGAVQDGVSAR